MSNSADIEERILDLAGRLYAVKKNFTVKELAEKTGVSRMTIYRLCGSKEALLLRLKNERGVQGILPSPSMADRILQAAGRCFARRGIQGATIASIAQEAGVGVASVYRLFGDKENILRKYIDRSARQPMLTGLNAEKDLRGCLEALALNSLNKVYAGRNSLLIMFRGGEMDFESYRDMVRGNKRTLHALTEYFQKTLSPEIAARFSCEELAIAFLGMIMSYAFLIPLSYGIELTEPERISKLITQIFLDGISRQ